VVRTREELAAALATFSDKELVFIDTAGQSPNEPARLQVIRELLGAQSRIHTYLVISATTKHSDIKDLLRRFETLSYEGLIITKLDESRSHGLLLNAPHWSGQPLAYLGVGQEVPRDVEVAAPERIADIVLSLSERFSER